MAAYLFSFVSQSARSMSFSYFTFGIPVVPLWKKRLVMITIIEKVHFQIIPCVNQIGGI